MGGRGAHSETEARKAFSTALDDDARRLTARYAYARPRPVSVPRALRTGRELLRGSGASCTPLDTRTFPSLVPTRTLSRRVVRLLF